MGNHLSFRPIRDFPAFDRFIEELVLWVDGISANVDVLYEAASALSRHVRANSFAAEHLIAALQSVELRIGNALVVEPAARRRRDERHVQALRLLMETCYGSDPDLRLVRG